MTFVISIATAFVTASIFQCTPIRKAWDVDFPGACINVNALFFANANLEIFQDIVIYVLPVRMLYQIQIPKRQKIALMMVFAVWGFVVITGMIRLNSLKVAQNTPDPSCKQSPSLGVPITFNSVVDDNYGAAVWSAIECNVGVVCACLPSFKPLIDRLFPGLMGYSHGPSNTIPQEASPVGRRGYSRKPSQRDFELEHGIDWEDSYPGNNRYNISTAANGRPPFDTNSSEEYLRGVQTHGKSGGIWKSTNMVVSRGDV